MCGHSHELTPGPCVPDVDQPSTPGMKSTTLHCDVTRAHGKIGAFTDEACVNVAAILDRARLHCKRKRVNGKAAVFMN